MLMTDTHNMMLEVATICCKHVSQSHGVKAPVLRHTNSRPMQGSSALLLSMHGCQPQCSREVSCTQVSHTQERSCLRVQDLSTEQQRSGMALLCVAISIVALKAILCP